MRRRMWGLALALIVALQTVLPAGSAIGAPAAAPAAAGGSITLQVQAARTLGAIHKGDNVQKYEWLINKDDAGDPLQPAAMCSTAGNSNYPDGCNWPSVHATRGGTSTGVVATGDQSTPPPALPAGKYLVSVMANGFKLDGSHFTVPTSGPVRVPLQPEPVPLATMRAQVFEDNAGVNGQWDEADEHGLAGFVGHLNDVTGEVTTDWFGNPLCTQYANDGKGHVILNSAGKPTITVMGGKCLSDANGQLVIPNLAPNRYELFVIPPDGQTWIQTTTLEGSHSWEGWLQEADMGYQTEVVRGGLPIPEILAGFVRPTSLGGNPSVPTTGSPGLGGGIKGTIVGVSGYAPPQGGITFGAEAGNKILGPVGDAYLALGDLQNGDTTVYVGTANADGTFAINGVPNGDYEMSVWDRDQDYLLETANVTVSNGQVTDVGNFYLAFWFGTLRGTVCNDLNGNGKCDPGEPGIPNLPVQILDRDNTVQDQGTVVSNTDANGHYTLAETYPLGQWMVEQAYFERFKTTGVTYQCENQPNETTVQGAGVDVNVLAGVGKNCRVDWAVQPYAAGANGGIVGEVVYDTTRNETDARMEVLEQYEAGLPTFTANLYQPVPCTPSSTSCDANKAYELATDGSYKKGTKLNTYTSETWQRPTDGTPAAPQDRCVPRDQNGVPQTYPWVPTKANGDCLETFAMNAQVVTNFGTDSGNTKVNGNYGFTSIGLDAQGNPIPAANQQPLPAGDYLVDIVTPTTAAGIFKPVREEDVNVFGGTSFVPQVPPFPCAGALHTVHVTNPDFLANGGSPFEGQQKPYCNTRLVTVQSGKSATPNFFFFSDVPLPGRFHGLLTDDMTLSTNPNETNFGEKAGVANIPIGVYDFYGRLVYTVTTDPNGVFEVILPSTSANTCPTPSSACPGVYRFVANDPGQPGSPNANYSQSYRTIATNFQLWPNSTQAADLAMVPIATLVEGPGTSTLQPVACQVPATQPQLFAVSAPYIQNASSNRQVTISGLHFGTPPVTGGDGGVQIDTGSARINATIVNWSDTVITASMPKYLADNKTPVPDGAYRLLVRTSAGQETTNGVTFHFLGSKYNPVLMEVGPGKTFATIQSALDAAAQRGNALVVVYPNTAGQFNPLGTYYENIIIHSSVKLQGVGPGGTRPDGSSVKGSIIDGSGFNSVPNQDTNWRTTVSRLSWNGNQSVYDAETVYVLPPRAAPYQATFKPGIDGFSVQGGDQLDFPGNLNDNGGGPVPNPAGDPTPPVPVTQGGGIFVNGYASYFQITNNVIQGNGGAYGGGIRLGTPYIGSNHNDHIRIANNSVKHNGGGQLAGAIGVFAGSDSYEISNNDICGNSSAEYGGGISHFGLSPSGSIHDNKIYFNGSYDEGGGIIVAGELTSNPASQLSPGSGAVDIYNNLIQQNIANDDGGGLRFLMPGNFPINVYNNMIVNNVSTHEGGGIALDDATNVRIFNNTIMKNLTTATAQTSNGKPAPAGISDTGNSKQLQATLPAAHAKFSDPLLFNNIIWDNRAGSFDLTLQGIKGIGMAGDPGPINIWDLGTADASGKLSPTNSVIDSVQNGGNDSYNDSPSNVHTDPKVKQVYDTVISALAWRGDPHFVGTVMVVLDTTPLTSDYHLADATSPASDAGAANAAANQAPSPVNAPAFDIDANKRPSIDAKFDVGADQLP